MKKLPKLIKELDYRKRKNGKTKVKYGLYECSFCCSYFEKPIADIQTGRIISCGCRKKMKPLQKEVNGFKVVKDLLEVDKNNNRIAIYRCKHCEKEFTARVYNITSGRQKSCGCKAGNRTHENSKTRLYNLWSKIKARVTSTKRKDSKYYSLKGIKMCNEWVKSFELFKKWALENGYKENLTIDRIDPDGDYEPNNCRFVDYHIQAVNKSSFRKGITGYKGVIYNKKTKKYITRIMINSKRIKIGIFNNAIEAGLAYDKYITENNLKEYKTNKELGWL